MFGERSINWNAGDVRRHVASNPGGRWNSKRTSEDIEVCFLFLASSHSVDGVGYEVTIDQC